MDPKMTSDFKPQSSNLIILLKKGANVEKNPDYRSDCGYGCYL